MCDWTDCAPRRRHRKDTSLLARALVASSIYHITLLPPAPKPLLVEATYRRGTVPPAMDGALSR